MAGENVSKQNMAASHGRAWRLLPATKYLGSYYLSEQVRVDTNRLEIAELEEGDTDPDVITGGYLLQESSQQ